MTQAHSSLPASGRPVILLTAANDNHPELPPAYRAALADLAAAADQQRSATVQFLRRVA